MLSICFSQFRGLALPKSLHSKWHRVEVTSRHTGFPSLCSCPCLGQHPGAHWVGDCHFWSCGWSPGDYSKSQFSILCEMASCLSMTLIGSSLNFEGSCLKRLAEVCLARECGQTAQRLWSFLSLMAVVVQGAACVKQPFMHTPKLVPL